MKPSRSHMKSPKYPKTRWIDSEISWNALKWYKTPMKLPVMHLTALKCLVHSPETPWNLPESLWSPLETSESFWNALNCSETPMKPSEPPLHFPVVHLMVCNKKLPLLILPSNLFKHPETVWNDSEILSESSLKAPWNPAWLGTLNYPSHSRSLNFCATLTLIWVIYWINLGEHSICASPIDWLKVPFSVLVACWAFGYVFLPKFSVKNTKFR